MAEINFLELYNFNEDKEVLRNMSEETIQLYGFPCELKRWRGIQPVLDPLYQDHNTSYYEDETLYSTKNTHVYIDYNRFNQVLKAYGLALEDNTTLVGNMILSDMPEEDDIITIKMPYDTRYVSFKIGSSDIHKDICYSVVLNVMSFSEAV